MGNQLSRNTQAENDTAGADGDKLPLSRRDYAARSDKILPRKKYKNSMITAKPHPLTSSVTDTRDVKISRDCVRPRVRRGTLWEDPCFPRELAMEGSSLEGRQYKWMRPKEFCERPTLVDGRPSRHDVIQGSIGNCWMMATLAGIADNMAAIRRIIASVNYSPLSSGYDGVFHCRLWHYGQWVDVYIDDYLPVRPDPGAPKKYSLIGARSPDPNVLWVALVEKALAKFHGSYKGIEAREREYGWRLLTGGVPAILSQEKLRRTISDAMFQRIKTAMDNNCIITCCRHAGNRLHAYTVTGAKTHSTKGNIVRIRNPWGEEKDRISWLDKPERWPYSSEEDPKDFECREGEFWVMRGECYREFSQFCIGSFKAEYFDETDKTSTILHHRHTFYGQWKGESAGGPQRGHVFRNPKFQINIPGSKRKTKKVLFELTPRPVNSVGVCLYLYQITKLKQTRHIVCEEVQHGDNERRIFLIGGCPQYKYCLRPGKYLAIPVTQTEQSEIEFCLRIYSNSKIKSRPISGKCFHFDNTKSNADSRKLQYISGRWDDLYVDERNFPSVLHKMPQYLLSSSEQTEISIDLIQEPKENVTGIGIRIYEISKGLNTPVSRDFIEKDHSSPVHRSPIMNGLQSHSAVQLKGNTSYLLLTFPWTSTRATSYVMILGHDANTKVDCSLVKT